MDWKDLSRDAKSILEWIQSPLTNKTLIITVEKDSKWFMRCPAWNGDIEIDVTDSLFSEIKAYINEADDIAVIEQNESKLVFTMADDAI